MVNLQKRKVAKIPDEMRQKLARFAPDPVRCLLSLHSTGTRLHLQLQLTLVLHTL